MIRLRSTPCLRLIAAGIFATGLACCGGPAAPERHEAGSISPQVMADALHAVLESDRTVYARQVVHRLQDQEEVILASEHWQDDKALPLPAQMFRMGAEMVANKTDAFSYALISKWPVNKQNEPGTEAEIVGLDSVANNPSAAFYARESLGDAEYFTAVYADIAVSPACIACHNAHKDSPRDDFELGDAMGGVVIRILLTE